MKKFTFGMVGLVALIALGGQAKAYDQEITDSKCEVLFDKAEKLLLEADREIGVPMHDAYSKSKELKAKAQKTFKRFEACQAKTKVLQPCSNTNPLFKKCEE